jgi:hypothetical protein
MTMVGEPQDDRGCSADFGIRRALVRKPGMQKLQATSTSGPCGRRASRVWVFHRAAWPAAACRAAAHGQGRGKFEIVLDSWRLIHLMTSRASDETEFEILARKKLFAVPTKATLRGDFLFLVWASSGIVKGTASAVSQGIEGSKFLTLRGQNRNLFL